MDRSEVHRPAGEAVLGGVGQPYRLVQVVEGEHGQHRTEYLLAGQPHTGVHVVEDGRLQVAAAGVGKGPGAAREQAGAFGQTRIDVVLYAPQVVLADQGTHLGGGVERVADAQFACAPDDRLRDAVGDRGVDQQPGGGGAHLTLVEEDAPGGGGGGPFEVGGVREDDVGRLAAQLQPDALEVGVGGVAQEVASDGRGAGEGQDVDVGVEAQRPPRHGPVAVDHVEYARGKPGLGRDPAEEQRGQG